MERLAGIAENVRHTIDVSAGGSRTDHLALFEIGGVRLSFRGREPVSIDEGDELVVVWEPGEKGFQTVLAFHNRTVGARDHDVRPNGCAGCGCSPPLLISLLLVSAGFAAADGRWDRVAVRVALLLLVLAIAWIARRTARDHAERLRQVDELLTQSAS